MLFFAALMQAQAGEPPSLYNAIVVLPTGKNGYEDYLKGIDMLRSAGAAAAIESVSTGDSKLTYLQGERALAERFDRALAVIRGGNAKPVANPRPTVEADEKFPELNWVGIASRLYAARAYVLFADGNAGGGLASLIDSSTMATNIQANGPLQAYAAGVGPNEEALRLIATELPRFSLVELTAAEQWAVRRLTAPPALLLSLHVEGDFVVQRIQQLVNADWRMRQSTNKDWLQELDAMSAAQKIAVQVPVDDAMAASSKAWTRMAALPEGKWGPPDHPAYSLWAERFVGPVDADMSGFVARLAIERTRLRLLILASRLRQYLWINEHLPTKLDAVAAPQQLDDPLSGGVFDYEVLGDKSFRVYSKGTDDTGRVDLLETEAPKSGGKGK